MDSITQVRRWRFQSQKLGQQDWQEWRPLQEWRLRQAGERGCRALGKKLWARR